ncbi:hypothetical protein CHARACLAT_012567 [Characodon lateralis]|uniref:Uncharacterized protein n=1 Tax=Characodon lateralis TaxID=208331 RepID=A0ABU7D695_9TELE|nr:hypothetical protein [Characodon lateralis]
MLFPMNTIMGKIAHQTAVQQVVTEDHCCASWLLTEHFIQAYGMLTGREKCTRKYAQVTEKTAAIGHLSLVGINMVWTAAGVGASGAIPHRYIQDMGSNNHSNDLENHVILVLVWELSGNFRLPPACFC